jgi:ABC-type antimicrobial peptide transport system permease subunit
VAAGDRERVAAFLEERLADFGFDATSAPERLAAFHRVENTYLSTFQALGALGLLLGTIGLAAVAVRNVLERRRELALLRAVGYDARHVRLMIVAEHAWLVAAGLAIGLVSALVAIAPAAARRGGGPGGLRLIGLVALVAAAGLLSSAVAAQVAARAPLVPALRSE